MAGQCILVVDDDRDTLDMMDMLLRHEGYQPILWSDGDSAYELIRKKQPDLVLLDLRMGDPYAGWWTLDLLRHDPSTRRIPAVMYSANKDFLRRRATMLRAKGCDTLEKPFQPDELLAKIEEALQRQKRRSTSSTGLNTCSKTS